MSTAPEADSVVTVASAVMQNAVRVMHSLPPDFVVSEAAERPPGDEQGGVAAFADVSQILKDRSVQKWLRATIDTWPRGLFSAFVDATAIIGQILTMFGSGRQEPMLGLMRDPKNLELIVAFGRLSKEDWDDPANRDPIGMVTAMKQEIHRRGLAATTPFARTLTTLLGPDALLWLLGKSAEGVGKLQPHEFSRAGWPRLWEMDTQLAIEQELMLIDPDAEPAAKSVVALAWTATALASFMTPDVFLAEDTPYLNSQRTGHYTVSVGRGTHTIIRFDLPSLVRLVSIVEAGLKNELLSAADLMWTGAALARIAAVQAGTGATPAPHIESRYEVFLSHRGRAAKQKLALAARALPEGLAFLDCMTLPKGVINRMFIYASLARSEC